MRFIKESALDRADRRRFNELRRDVQADAIIETEFDDYVEKTGKVPPALSRLIRGKRRTAPSRRRSK